MSHDVFISFASLDNGSCHGDKKKWIERLEDALFTHLAWRLGRKPDIFYDKKSIKDGDKSKEIIKEALKESATMLVVLSPTWAKSGPCKSEYQYYQNVKKRAESNTFIIERLDIDSEDWNMLKRLFCEVDEIQRRKFYGADESGFTKTYCGHANDMDFYTQTDKLSWMIKSKLTKLEQPLDGERKRVFLYCATEGLSEESKHHIERLHWELKDFLQEKIGVSHLLIDWLTDEPVHEKEKAKEFELTEEIRKCDCFVQLVTANTQGLVNVNTQALEIAKKLKKPFAIWSATITDDEEITFSGPFEDFKDEVLSSLQTDDAEQEDCETEAKIESYAYIDRGDDSSGESLDEIITELRGRGFEVTPEETADDIEIIERTLQDPACSTLITIRRDSQPSCLNARINSELDQQIVLCRKETGIQRLILNASGLDNNQVSDEIRASDWQIVSQADQLVDRLDVKNIRYAHLSKN